MTGRVTDSRSIAQQVRARQQPRSQFLSGSVTAVDVDGNVTVNIGGIDLVELVLPAVPLVVGDSVQVLRQAGTYVVLGPSAPLARPTTGTVTNVPADSTTIVVTTNVGDLTCGWLDGYPPTFGDTVTIAWLGTTPLVLGIPGVTGTPPVPDPPTPPAPPVPPPPKITTGTTTFPASDDGTHRGGEWLSTSIDGGNVMAGDYGFGLNDGAWFYGGRIRSSLAGVMVTSARVWLGRGQGGIYAAQTVHLFRVTNDIRPVGDLTFDGATSHDVALAVGQSGWFTIPAPFAQTLVDSGGSIGIKAPSGPYVRLYGLKNKPNAGQLQITWRRSS